MPTTGGFLTPQRPRAKHHIALSMAFVGFLMTATSDLFSQGSGFTRVSHTREQARAYIDDYSNSLGGDNDFDAPRRLKGRSPVDANEQPIEIKTLRPLIRVLSDSLTQLTYALNDQMQSNQMGGLRQVYMESLRLSGTAVSIYKHSERPGADGSLQDEIQQLDADWRELAYRMGNTQGLSGDVRSLIANINDADLRIRQSMGIAPQLDRRQLYLKAAGLVADLENLQEDVATELGNTGNAKIYRQSIGRIRQLVLSMITVVRDDRQDASIIVDEFKQFEALWSPLVVKLRVEQDRYIERGLRRVAASAGEVQQLLLLPRKMDQSQFVYLATALKKDVDEFFERTPLILVMQLPKSKQALGAADQLYGCCAQFVETVNRAQDQADILDSFRKIEQAERVFIDVYRDVDSDKAVAVLNRIDQSLNALRSSLQIQRDDFDSRSAEDLAAAIQNITEQIETTSKDWLGQDRQPFANECLQDVADLSDRAAKLHDDIISGRSQTDLREDMVELYETWRRVYGYLTKCQSEDRPTLGRLSSSLTPAIVELRTMILQ